MTQQIPGLMQREIEGLIAYYRDKIGEATLLNHKDAVEVFKARVVELEKLLPKASNASKLGYFMVM